MKHVRKETYGFVPMHLALLDLDSGNTRSHAGWLRTTFNWGAIRLRDYVREW